MEFIHGAKEVASRTTLNSVDSIIPLNIIMITQLFVEMSSRMKAAISKLSTRSKLSIII